MISKREKFPILRLSFLVILIVLTIISFGGVPQKEAHFDKVPLSPIIYYFMYFLASGVILLLLSWVGVMVYRGRIVFSRTNIDIPIALFITYVVIWIPLSQSKYLVLTEFFKLMVLTALFYFVVNNIRAKQQVKFVIFSLMIVTSVICIYGLVNTAVLKNETVLGLQRFAGYKKRVSATYICPNHFAGLLGMMVPFAASYLILSRQRLTVKLLIGILGLVMVAAMVFTQSRGGWAALSAGLLSMWLISIRKVKVPLIAVLAPALVTTIMLVFLLASTPTLPDRITGTFQEDDKSFLGRKYAWLDTLDMAGHKVVQGSGPGTYRYVFTRFQRPGYFVQVNYAHNDYLQTLAEYGVIGLAIILAIVVIIARTAGKMLSILSDRDDFAFTCGLFGAFITISIHSFVDFNMHIPANAVLMVGLIGMLFSVRAYGLDYKSEFEFLDLRILPKKRRLIKAAMMSITALIAAVCLVVTTTRYLGDYYHHLGRQKDPSIMESAVEIDENSDQMYEEMLQNYLTAYRFDRGNPVHAGALAEAYLFRGRGPGKPTAAEGIFSGTGMARTFEDVKKSAEYGEEAVERNPMYGGYHLRLAQSLHLLSKLISIAESPLFDEIDTTGSKTHEEYTELARKHYEMALLTYPNSPQYNQALASFYLSSGEHRLAGHYARRTIELLVDSPKWKKREAAFILVKVARSFLWQKDYHSAKELAFEAAEQLEGGIDQGNPDLRNVLEGIAQSYLEHGDYSLASEVAYRLFDLLKGSPGWKKSEIAGVLEDLTGRFFAEGDYQSANESASMVIEMLKSAEHARKVELRDNLTDMAKQCYSREEYRIARQFALQAIDLMGESSSHADDARSILEESEKKLAEQKNNEEPIDTGASSDGDIDL